MAQDLKRQTEINEGRARIIISDNGVAVDDEEIRSDDTAITQPFDPTKIRVDTKPTTMDVLLKRLRDNAIDLTPGFQRKGGIWNDGAQSRLIESMLIRIPLPAFYIDASDDDKWLVVDGLQRLTAIKRYVIDEDLPLSGLEFLTDYQNTRFSDLPRPFQRRIEETDIVLYLIQPGTPARVKFDIFKRINTSGLPLSSQEIRHALNQGASTNLLKELAGSREFHEATWRGVSPKRMDDRECVLRFLAFCITPPSQYKTDDFDGFLNAAMANINNMSENKLLDLKNRFPRAMRSAKQIFGSDAFRKRYYPHEPRHPVNKALFESWSVNLDALDDAELDMLIKRKQNLQERFMLLMRKDAEFGQAISQGTGSIKRVGKRFEAVGNIIQEVLQ